MARARNGSEGSHRYRPGFGDVIVVVAIGLLVWVSVTPHRGGRHAARAEATARATLDRMVAAGERSGFWAALDRLFELAAEMPGLRKFDNYMTGEWARDFVPTWEDESYYYRLNLDPDVTTDSPIDAVPRKPGLTGNLAFRISDRGLTGTPLPGVEGDLDTSDSERSAQVRLGELAKHARAARLRVCLRDFCRVLADPEDAGSLTRERVDKDRPVPTGAQASLAYTVPGSYRYRMWIVPTPTGRHPELEIVSWPERHAEPGYQVFRYTREGGMQQTRNMVRRYEGSQSMPAPGAGTIRGGSQPDSTGGYTGADGNRWFPVNGSKP